jgi:hypothetical protein
MGPPSRGGSSRVRRPRPTTGSSCVPRARHRRAGWSSPSRRDSPSTAGLPIIAARLPRGRAHHRSAAPDRSRPATGPRVCPGAARTYLSRRSFGDGEEKRGTQFVFAPDGDSGSAPPSPWPPPGATDRHHPPDRRQPAGRALASGPAGGNGEIGRPAGPGGERTSNPGRPAVGPGRVLPNGAVGKQPGCRAVVDKRHGRIAPDGMSDVTVPAPCTGSVRWHLGPRRVPCEHGIVHGRRGPVLAEQLTGDLLDIFGGRGPRAPFSNPDTFPRR